MADTYAKLVQSDIGKRLADLLGLPQPVELRRHTPGEPLVPGVALLGGAPGGFLLDTASKLLVDAGTEVHEQPDEVAHAASQRDDTRYAAVVYDASGIETSEGLDDLYRTLQGGVRRLARNARIVVLAADPDQLGDLRHRTAQRALEGFTRSLAKEVGGKGATVNLINVAPDAEQGAVAPLRFFLSGRSAFVTGQVVTVGPPTDVAPATPADYDKPLAEKVAVVTGAARGIGAAIAETLGRDGAHVVCVDLPSAGQQLADVANSVGGAAFPLDVSAEDAPEKLVSYLTERHGGVDILVHNAGITRDKTLAGMDDKRWDMVLDINLVAIERINEHLLEQDALKDNGRIIALSSAVGGIAGNRGQTNYGATKAGIIGHVAGLAPTLAENGSTANAIAPGFIETEMTDKMPFGPREVGRRISSLGQGGQPLDVAEAIAYLAGPDTTWINGTVLRVCGQSLLGA